MDGGPTPWGSCEGVLTAPRCPSALQTLPHRAWSPLPEESQAPVRPLGHLPGWGRRIYQAGHLLPPLLPRGTACGGPTCPGAWAQAIPALGTAPSGPNNWDKAVRVWSHVPPGQEAELAGLPGNFLLDLLEPRGRTRGREQGAP